MNGSKKRSDFVKFHTKLPQNMAYFDAFEVRNLLKIDTSEE